jgi:putative sterol carrier protein
METTNSDLGAAPLAADTQALAGLVGRLRLQIADRTVGVLVVHDGHLELTGDDGSVDATLVCATREDVIATLRGEINPVVAALRNKLRVTGNRAFGAKVIMGLRAASPFARLPIDTSPYVGGAGPTGKGA